MENKNLSAIYSPYKKMLPYGWWGFKATNVRATLTQKDNLIEFAFPYDYCYDWRNIMKQYRKRNKITQTQLAAKLGVPMVTLRCWEQEINRPPLDKWRQLEEIFNSENI